VINGFALAGFDRFLAAMRGLASGQLAIERFSNGELHVALGASVRGADCALVGSIAPPDERLTGYLLAAHTLSRDGARSITAVLPYLAYTRQDANERGKSLAAEWIGRLLAASGVDRVATVDVHSEAAISLSPIPIESVSPAPLFAGELARIGLHDYVVVAPDEGGVDRARDLAAAAKLERPVVVFRKRRSAGGIVHLGMTGELHQTAVVVDDILDTGATLVSCCELLRSSGVNRIVVCVTHGLFTGHAWRAIWHAGVERIYTTDSVRGTNQGPAEVRVLSVAPLLAATAFGAASTYS
jgi:ribose-phosphate pyrophosphokinase